MVGGNRKWRSSLFAGVVIAGAAALSGPAMQAVAATTCVCPGSETTTTSSSTTTTTTILETEVEPIAVERAPDPAVGGTLPRTQWKSSAKQSPRSGARVAIDDCPCLPEPVVSEAPFAVLVPVVGGAAVVATLVWRSRRANRASASTSNSTNV
jgi:hypothetical protein